MLFRSCRSCDIENVLAREFCPHCGESSRRPDDDVAARIPREDAEDAAAFEQLRATAVMVGKSLAVSAVAVLVLVGGAKAAHSAWPVTMWPREVPSFTPPPETSADPSGVAQPTTDAGTPAAACTPGDGTVTDVRGRTFDYWDCAVEGTGSVLQRPDPSSKVMGDLRESPSWFVCQTQGGTDPQTGGKTWLYTQGDDHYFDDGWGYFPAGLVSSSWVTGIVPDLPGC